MTRKFLLFLLPFLLVGCVGGASASDELAICSSLPLSNGRNARAQSMSRAIEQAINERGSVTMGGQRYRLRYVAMDGAVFRDAGEDEAVGTDDDSYSWDTEQETRNARAAITEHNCVAYIGTYNSGAAKISMPILNRVQMAMISPGNTYPGLTKEGGGIGDEPWIYSPLGPDKRNYCRVVPADDLQAPAAARYAATIEGVESVFVFHDTEVYGKGLATLFAAAATENGLTLAGEITGFGANMTPEAMADIIMRSSPDLVYFGGVTKNRPGEVLRALRAADYTGYFMGADGIAEDEFLDRAGQSDPRVYATLVGLPPSELTSEAARQWLDAYQSRYGEPDAFAAPSYEAALVVMDAIERAQVPDDNRPFVERVRPAILQAVKETKDFQGILSPWSFDDNCDTSDTTISITQANDGTFAFVEAVTSE